MAPSLPTSAPEAESPSPALAPRLATLAGGMAVGTAALAGLRFLMEPAAALGPTIMTGLVGLVCLTAHALGRGGRSRLGMQVLVGGNLTLLFALSWFTGGLHLAEYSVVVPLVAIAGVHLGQRAGVLAGISTAGWTLWLALAERSDWLPPHPRPTATGLGAAVLLFDLALIALVLWPAAHQAHPPSAATHPGGATNSRPPSASPEQPGALHVRTMEREAAEHALHQAKDFAENLVASAAALIVCLDPAGRILVFNTAAETLTGYTRADLLGRDWFETVVPRERHPQAWAEFQRLQAGGPPGQLELPLRTKDGKERFIVWRNSPLREGDRVVGAICLGIDVTGRRRVEQALAKERDLVARLVETSPSGILVVDPAGRIVFANAEAERILFLRRTDATRHEYAPFDWRLLHPDGSPVPAAERTFRRVLDTGRPLHDVRHLLRWDSGRSVLLSLNAAPLFDAAGCTEGIVATIEDITERARAEEALRHSEEQYRRLFNAGNDALFVHGFDPEAARSAPFSQVNDIACQMLGYTRDELLARTPDDLMAPAAPAAAEVFDRLRRERHALFETELVGRDGRRLPVEVNSRVFDLDARPTVLSVVRDVSERHRLEAQLRQAQKMEVFGQLAGGVAHDFNNLLVAIIGNAELLLEAPELAGRSREQVAEIQEAGRRAAALTRQLLLFARKQPAQPVACDLGAIVANHAKLLQRIIGEQVALAVAPAPGPLPIVADVNMIEQVAMNLVVNARDAMPHGGTLVVGTARAVLDEAGAARCACSAGEYAALVVRDTGCGIPAAVRQRIFEPFFTTKPAGQGTGLGLSTVLGIVQQHHGGIALASEEGHGTEFTVYLPLAVEPARPESALAIGAAAPTDPATILVVEDDQSVRTILERTLRRAGYRVLLVASAAECLEQLEHDGAAVDLVLSDVVLPGEGGGAQLGTIIAARWPALPLRLVGSSAEELGENDWPLLEKPFSAAGLLAFVRAGARLPGTGRRRHARSGPLTPRSVPRQEGGTTRNACNRASNAATG